MASWLAENHHPRRLLEWALEGIGYYQPAGVCIEILDCFDSRLAHKLFDHAGIE